MWLKAALIVITSIAVIALATVWIAQRRWHTATAEMQARLLAASPASMKATVFSARQLDDLPPPVARYLRAVLREGQPIARRVRVTWVGEFNMGSPGTDKWVPFAAEQDFVPGAPGFVWDARMKTAPGLAANVRDSYVAGTGSMQGKVLGLFTVVDKQGGGAFATAALQRYMGEAMWLPIALLPSQGVYWDPIDEHRARATVRDSATSATLEFRFDADGRVESVYASERTYDDGKGPPRLLPWQARVLRYGEIDGVTVPIDATVEWLMPTGAYVYWRGRPTRIAYDDGTAP